MRAVRPRLRRVLAALAFMVLARLGAAPAPGDPPVYSIPDSGIVVTLPPGMDWLAVADGGDRSAAFATDDGLRVVVFTEPNPGNQWLSSGRIRAFEAGETRDNTLQRTDGRRTQHRGVPAYDLWLTQPPGLIQVHMRHMAVNDRFVTIWIVRPGSTTDGLPDPDLMAAVSFAGTPRIPATPPGIAPDGSGYPGVRGVLLGIAILAGLFVLVCGLRLLRAGPKPVAAPAVPPASDAAP